LFCQIGFSVTFGPDSPTSTSLIARITGVYHHALPCLYFIFLSIRPTLSPQPISVL
jgi:hypothetical protein